MDEAIDQSFLGQGALSGLSDAALTWLGGQPFIGYQACALLMQHWLIDKCCTMPARDAVRVGYDVTVNDGTSITSDTKAALDEFDEDRDIRRQMVEFVRWGRGFGIRVALFEVDSPDPRYYEKPFNPDGVTPGSYRGISQIDPYWMTPWLSQRASTNPAARDFYAPTWWMINGRRYHHSHLIIMRTAEPADLLKPTYLYGGVPVPQRILERVFAAERVASEGPALALSKRATVLHTDVSAALQDQQAFEQRMSVWRSWLDNFGVKIIGTDETLEQFETSLADLDAVIMNSYQLVAAAAGVPATKLLGTTPKGFNPTGEYDESAYHEELESIQEHDLTPFLRRHHLLAIRSHIAPRFGIPPFRTKPVWHPLDALTAKEQAEVNKIRADTDAVYVNAGALDAEDVRGRIVEDESSGYSGLSAEAPGVTNQDAPENISETEGRHE